MNIINRIKYFILRLQELFLSKKLESTTQGTYTNSFGKQVYLKGVSLKIEAQIQDKINEVNTNVEAIADKTACSVDELIKYIELAKTKVYNLKNANKLLNLVFEEEGIIYEKRGLLALYLSIITGQGFKLKTEPMFILQRDKVDKFELLHSFYRWYSLKTKLPGFEYETQKKFKEFRLCDGSDDYIKHLSTAENISLQDAIARDNEASEFVLNYMKKVEGSKNVLDKLKTNGSANI